MVADDAEYAAVMVSVATWAPEKLTERRERAQRAADTRTPEEIWRDLLDAEARGWRN
ncbi:MAG: hypothetical protein WC265_08380 [Dysgonamonadaceae bacterium]